MKKFLKYTFFTLLGLALAFFAYLYLYPSAERNIHDFIPEDAIFIVESRSPIENWNEFSESGVWQYLKSNKELAETNEQADYMDSLITDNSTLFGLIGDRDVYISAHMTKRDDYDFLYLIDLKRGAKITFFKDVVLGILDDEALKYDEVEKDGHEILRIYDDEGDAIMLAFVDNILVCSYSDKIILSSLAQSETPYFSANESFVSIFEDTDKSGPYRIFLHYPRLPDYMNMYLDEPSETLTDITSVMEFTSADFEIEDEFVSLEGYATVYDSVPSTLKGMLEVDPDKLRAPKILPANTSFFISFDFEDFFSREVKMMEVSNGSGGTMMKDSLTYQGFYGKILSGFQDSPKEYEEIMKNQRRVEKFLKISFEEHLFSWIGNEITMAMVPVSRNGAKQSYLGLFHAKNIDDAQEGLGFITHRIKKKTPVKFKQYDYKGFDVNYMEMKGFFRLFFGKLFKKFEKPYFIYLDDFVVFSNDTEALHRMIDSYQLEQTLKESPTFNDFHNEFSGQSNLFLYLNTPNLFPWLARMGDHETQMTVDENRNYFNSFRMAGFQLKEDGDKFSVKAYADFYPIGKAVN